MYRFAFQTQSKSKGADFTIPGTVVFAESRVSDRIGGAESLANWSILYITKSWDFDGPEGVCGVGPGNGHMVLRSGFCILVCWTAALGHG